MIDQIAKFDGDSAFRWASTIADSERRKAALTVTVSAWGAEDPAATSAAIGLAEYLSAKEKSELKEVIPKK